MNKKIFINDIVSCFEQIAPSYWQEDYDNAGLLVGNLDNECYGILICLDVFADTVKEAIRKKCNLIISHHPFIFRGIKKLLYNDETTEIITLLLKNDIAVYSSHTNMDSCSTGVNYMLARELDFESIIPLDNSRFSTEKKYFGNGAVGILKEKIQAVDFLSFVKERLSLKTLKYIGDECKIVEKVGICGGSGSFLIEKAIEKNCDIFLTGDLKYHEFLSHIGKIIIADIGHFESEQFIKQRIFDIISKRFTNFAPLYIAEEKNRIKIL